MSTGPVLPSNTVTTCRQWLQRPGSWIGASVGFIVLAGLSYRLGQGRLSGFYYQCLLLSLWLSLGALLCVTVFAGLRAQSPRHASVIARARGPLVFMLIFLGLYGIAQGVCWYLNTERANRIVREGTHSTGESYAFDRVLGYGPKPNTLGDARFLMDGEVVFAYQYTTDEQRRRIVPASPASGGPYTRALLLFGGSYAFGEGVNDDETLAHELAKRLPNTRVYNYAFSGYGTGQLLARLESYDLRAEVAEPEVAALYVFIPNHVRRVNGSYSVINWSRHSPYYQLTPQGGVERLGSFQGERPLLTAWYDFLHGDQLFQYFQLDFPPTLRASHFRLTTAMVAASQTEFEERFQRGAFHMVLYPHRPQDEFESRHLVPDLEAAGISVIDCTDLFPPDMTNLDHGPHDPHPTAKAHALLAEALSKAPLFETSSVRP